MMLAACSGGSRAGAYVGGSVAVECAPFARALSGIRLSGAAADWERREILVTQANWVRDRVSEDQPVIDVSAANDWSVVRVWWPPVSQMGVTEYPAYGFVSADRPTSHDQLIAATPRAIRIAQSE